MQFFENLPTFPVNAKKERPCDLHTRNRMSCRSPPSLQLRAAAALSDALEAQEAKEGAASVSSAPGAALAPLGPGLQLAAASPRKSRIAKRAGQLLILLPELLRFLV